MNINPALRKDLEMEIKFVARSPEDLSAVRAAFMQHATDVLRERTYVTTIRYYDTDGFDLLKSGVTLRKMDESKPYFAPEIDVKTIGHVTKDGVLVRDEYQFPMIRDEFNLAVVTGEAKNLLQPADGKELREIFYTVNARSDVRIAFQHNAKKVAVELCLEKTDYVDAITGFVFKSSFEFELELSHRHSDESLTHDEAVTLMATLGGDLLKTATAATHNPKSKAETGFAFYTGAP